MSTLERITATAARVVLREVRVDDVVDLSPRFRRVDVSTAGAVRFEPGQKVQFRVRGLDFRTYTPYRWDGRHVSFLLFRHDAVSPAAEFGAGLRPGGTFQVFGPRRAVDLSSVTTGPIFVGDETSFALAAAWQQFGTAPAAAEAYEVSDVSESTEVVERLGLASPALVGRSDDDAHHDRFADEVVALARRHPNAPVVLTGKAQSIRAVRAAVKAADLAPKALVKTHWDPRRRGLD